MLLVRLGIKDLPLSPLTQYPSQSAMLLVGVPRGLCESRLCLQTTMLLFPSNS